MESNVVPLGDSLPVLADLSDEAVTIRAVMAAAVLAFCPQHPEKLTLRQTVDFCCGLVRFMEVIGKERPLWDVRACAEAVSNLRLNLSPASTDGICVCQPDKHG